MKIFGFGNIGKFGYWLVSQRKSAHTRGCNATIHQWTESSNLVDQNCSKNQNNHMESLEWSTSNDGQDCRKGMKVDYRCQLCGCDGESINYVLFNCTIARHIWAMSDFPCPRNGCDANSIYANIHHPLVFGKNPSIPLDIQRSYPWIHWVI